MKIIFLGTPDFAVASLEAVVHAGYEVQAVVTSPDKPAGRGLQLRESAVKKFALSHGIRVLQPVRLTDPVFLDEIRQLAPDLMIVVAFRMMPEILWSMPPLGTFNLHASLLPQYRGAAPINRAVMNGETETGVTTFFLKHQIDTGHILFRESVTIDPDETAGSLHDRLMKVGAALVLKTVEAIRDHTIKAQPQEAFMVPGSALKEAPKLFPDDCKIRWDQPLRMVYNHIRGLSPFPGAYTSLKSGADVIQLKIYLAKPVAGTTTGLPGKLTVSGQRMFIQCSDGSLEVLELQQQGKKRMTAADFLRGFRNIDQWQAF